MMLLFLYTKDGAMVYSHKTKFYVNTQFPREYFVRSPKIIVITSVFSVTGLAPD